MTKSGAMGGNLRFCSGVSASHRSRQIQAASGELSAPLGNLKIVSLFCHFGKIQRIHVVTAYEKSRFHPGLTKEGYSQSKSFVK